MGVPEGDMLTVEVRQRVAVPLPLRDPLEEPLGLNVTDGVYDTLEHDEAVSEAVDERQSVGVPEAEIDGVEVRQSVNVDVPLRDPLVEPLGLNVTDGVKDMLEQGEAVCEAVDERQREGVPDTDMETVEVRHRVDVPLPLRDPLEEPLGLNVTDGVYDTLEHDETVSETVDERQSVGVPDAEVVGVEVRQRVDVPLPLRDALGEPLELNVRVGV